MTSSLPDRAPTPFSAALVPFPVEGNLPGLPSPHDVRELLSEQFDAAVVRERERRGQVLKPSDVWPMVRAVQSFTELVDDYARALTTVSKGARKVQEEELFEAVGESDGIPVGPLNVPHEGSIISVKAKTANEYDIDAGQVIGCLAASVSAQWSRHAPASGGYSQVPRDDPEGFAIAVALRALEMVGASQLKVTHVKALALELGQMGEDALSSVVTDAISKRRLFKGVTVERKDDPKASRSGRPVAIEAADEKTQPMPAVRGRT